MDELKSNIISLLKSHKEGCTISDLVRFTKAGRATIMIRLAELRIEQKLKEQRVGSAKLLFLK